MNLPSEIYSVASVRRIDRAAIENAGISGYSLMTRAAKAAYDAATNRFPWARRWLVVCGGGNNGGDGYVVGRLAAEAGMTVSVIAATAPDKLAGDARTACTDMIAAGGAVTSFDRVLDADADLIIDGLLGTGLQRPVEGAYAELVDAMNGHAAPVVSLDIPSGIHGDTGEMLGTAVKADLTVTFVGLKCGLFLDCGRDRVGNLCFSGLDIPEECRVAEPPVMRRIDDNAVRQSLVPRARTAHKGSYGHLLIVGGGPGMPGAVRICGEAALRSGAGLVTIATHPDHSALIAGARPELMCHGVNTAEDLLPLLERATVIAVGPGLGTSDWSGNLLPAVLGADLPVIVDADALNLLGTHAARKGNWILTPHPGEAGRLLAKSAAEIQADRVAALGALVRRFGATVVLKGAGTLISAAEGPPWLCSAGNPGMASPGMGDALTGIIAALRAQGLTEEDAAKLGVQIHAEAGDRAARGGERGLLVSDLLAEIRGGVNP